MIQSHPFSANIGSQLVHLRIMETTDLHVHVFPYDYYTDQPSDSVGLARTAALISKGRREAANSILVDNGDFLQGSPLGDYIAYERGLKHGDLHPIIAAMNSVGYDAATLGNHEFNYGLEFLTNVLARAEFPLVCANVALKFGSDPSRDTTFLPPYVLLDRIVIDGAGQKHPIRIGIIGFLPPQIMHWDETHLHGNIETRDILATARAYIPQMKEEGADIIIALSHSGIGNSQESDGMENASIPLARIDGIDAIVAGHSHQVFPSPQFQGTADIDIVEGKIAGKPAVMAGFWGSHLGVIDLLLEQNGGKWSVIDSRSEARPISTRSSDGKLIALVESEPSVLRAVKSDHLATLRYMRSQVGRTRRPLHSYFALIANCEALQLVCRAQTVFITTKLAGTKYAGLPILAAAAPFKAGGRAGPEHYTDIPIGGLELRNVADLYAFPNTIRAVQVTGAQITDWLERSAALFNQITPGIADQALLNPDFPSYNFDIITGLTYEIDPSQPPRYATDGKLINPASHRIKNLRFQDRPLDPTQVFIVATNSYRVSTCNVLSKLSFSEIAYEAPVTIRQILLQYIATHQPITSFTEPNWRLTDLPETTLLFDSSPRARDHLPDVPGLSIEPVGDCANGFVQYRLQPH